ncbi:MAG: LysM peptidoglycan-binding domain-containing protein [Alphaproteobacteria bacterium]|nr:LysM peptidoglycan-binding domain-containing protein [Alphaproteobacteria bacterium]
MKYKQFFLIFLCFFLTACNVVRVSKGDTLYSISRRKNVSVRALIERNHLTAPYTLKIGQRLIIPRTEYYRVHKGDTLYSIAKRYNMTVSSLARLNKISAPYTLSVGQRLQVSDWGNTTTSKTQKTATKKSTIQKNEKEPNVTPKKITVPKSAQSKRFDRPSNGKIVATFGTKNGIHNDGINFAGKLGDPIKAADAGQVVYAGNELKGYGNLILIKHNGGWITAYAHNNAIWVKKGATVVRGQKIATMGKTGSVKTPQLHFEVRYKTKVVDPMAYLK